MEVLMLLKDTSASALGSPCETICLVSGRPLSEQSSLGEGLRICASAICTHLHTYSCKTLELPDKGQLHLPQFSSLSMDLPEYFFFHVLLLSFFPQVNVDKDRSLLLDWDRVRVFDREIAQMFLNMTKLEKEAQVGRCTHDLSLT